MRIDILTALPNLFTGPLSESILKRAQQKNLLSIHIHDIRDFSTQKQKSIDDYAYGGGAGMVMTCQPIADAIETLKEQRTYDDIIYMTPDGITLNQSMCNTMSTAKNLLILCGHYKGVDQRLRDLYITKEISIGDFVLTGGELAASVVIDSVVRLIPGVLNDETSALSDSFQDDLLAPPVYTRPHEFKGLVVPEILLSGDPKKVEQWRHDQSMERTKTRRPDLLK
jgi:tRNA (guanine37-N1)-methyltransferase